MLIFHNCNLVKTLMGDYVEKTLGGIVGRLILATVQSGPKSISTYCWLLLVMTLMGLERENRRMRTRVGNWKTLASSLRWV